MKCPHCGHDIETQQRRAAESRWAGMTAAQRAAEMSRVRKLGVKRSKTKARPLRQNDQAHRSAPGVTVERKENDENSK